MKFTHSVIAGGVAVSLAAIGAHYFGGTFKLYFLVLLVAVYVIISLTLKYQEKALAKELTRLSEDDQEELLSHLPPKDRDRVRKDMAGEA